MNGRKKENVPAGSPDSRRDAGKHLFRLLGDIDASLIEEADSARAAAKHRVIPFKVWIPAAACLLLVAVAGGIVQFSTNVPVSTGSTYTALTSAAGSAEAGSVEDSSAALAKTAPEDGGAAAAEGAAAADGGIQEDGAVPSSPENSMIASYDPSTGTTTLSPADPAVTEDGTVSGDSPQAEGGAEMDSSPSQPPLAGVPSVYSAAPTILIDGIGFQASSPDPAEVLDESVLGDPLTEDLAQIQADFPEVEEIREAAGMNPECAVAIRMADGEGFQLYINPWYSFDTLGDLIEDLNLRENLTFGAVYDDQSVYTLPDPDAVWDLLLSDPTLVNMGSGSGSEAAASMSIDLEMEPSDFLNGTLAVTENGYLHTNLFQTAKTFYIGEDAARTFFEFVRENGVPEGK